MSARIEEQILFQWYCPDCVEGGPLTHAKAARDGANGHDEALHPAIELEDA